jgi:hypothetical protein
VHIGGAAAHKIVQRFKIAQPAGPHVERLDVGKARLIANRLCRLKFDHDPGGQMMAC